jgi:chromosomal replication initiation ATPase DnaA
MIAHILSRCAAYYGVSPDLLKSGTRRRAVVYARQAAAYCLHLAYGHMAYVDIAAAVGWADHTTVVYALAVVPERFADDSALEPFLTGLAQTVHARPPALPPGSAPLDHAMRWWAAQGRLDWRVSAA